KADRADQGHPIGLGVKTRVRPHAAEKVHEEKTTRERAARPEPAKGELSTGRCRKPGGERFQQRMVGPVRHRAQRVTAEEKKNRRGPIPAVLLSCGPSFRPCPCPRPALWAASRASRVSRVFRPSARVASGWASACFGRRPSRPALNRRR